MADNLPDIYVKLHGLKGECTDFKHPGKDGWIEIKRFSFGFGVKGGESETPAKITSVGADGKPITQKELDKKLAERERESGKKKTKGKEDDGPFDRPEVELQKSFDSASTNIWRDKCHKGDPIKKLEVQACRYGGEGGDEKIPFLRLIFNEVVVKSVNLELGVDSPPEETIRFQYDTVKIQYIWTANDTGSRVRGASAPRAGWNFPENKPAEWLAEDHPD